MVSASRERLQIMDWNAGDKYEFVFFILSPSNRTLQKKLVTNMDLFSSFCHKAIYAKAIYFTEGKAGD